MGLAQDRADDGASQSTGQTGPGGGIASNNDAAPDKDASAAREAAREARVERRLNHLELLRNIGMEIAAGLGHAAARRHQFDTSAFARIADPAASFNRLSLAIRRIVALEELLEEDAATRAAQLAAQRALQERRAARERAEEEKQIVRRTVKMAHSDANPGIERDRQENLLNDLFDNYELYNEGPLAEVVANICTDLGLIPDLRHWGEAPEEGCEPDPVKIRARTLETAAEYLELVMNPGAAPSAAPAATPPPGEGGRGPP
jgi:hypothetical protein